jgi:hypothetical protein
MSALCHSGTPIGPMGGRSRKIAAGLRRQTVFARRREAGNPAAAHVSCFGIKRLKSAGGGLAEPGGRLSLI